MTTSAQRALAPRKQPRQGRARATVASILEAAAQVLETVGFEKMTTTRVAERAGTSVGSLYQYFPSKDALLYALLERKVDTVLAGLTASVDDSLGKPFEERTRLLIEALFRAKAQRAKLGAELARQASRLDKRDIFRRLAESNHRLVRRLLDEHASELSIEDPELTSWVLVHAVTGVADAAMLGPLERLRDPTFIAAVTELVLGAVRFDTSRLGPPETLLRPFVAAR